MDHRTDPRVPAPNEREQRPEADQRPLRDDVRGAEPRRTAFADELPSGTFRIPRF